MELPETNNFYASVTTRSTPERIAEGFGLRGWSVRKCSWRDYEVGTEFGELVIESGDPVLIHGVVADTSVHARVIVGLLVEEGLSGSYECYDPAGKVVESERFGEVGPAI